MDCHAKCMAAYNKCMAGNPDQLHQIQCTFKLIQCLLKCQEQLIAKELKASGKKKKPKK